MLEDNGMGYLTLYNKGLNKNNSQFIITMSKEAQVYKKFTIFGKAVSGLDVLKKINNNANNKVNTPGLECRIKDCGEI